LENWRIEKNNSHEAKESYMEKKGGGMPNFERDHWEKKMDDVNVADGRYGSEMNQAEEYKRQVDALASYAKKHKMQY
jgi:hypothetical protein